MPTYPLTRLALLSTILLAPIALAKPVTTPLVGICSDIVEYKGKAVFCHENQIFGSELVISDGSPTGSRVIKDIDVGPGGSSPTTPIEFNGELYFVAENSEVGVSLWKTDGSEAGTVLLMRLSNQFVEAAQLAATLGNTAFITVGNSLISTQGTTETTKMLSDLVSRSLGSILFSSKLYFISKGDPRLMSITRQGDIQQITSFDGSRAEIRARLLDGKIALLVDAFTPDENDPVGTTNAELWLSDGTSSGTSKGMNLTDLGLGIVGQLDKGLLLLDTEKIEDQDLYLSTDGVSRDLITTVDSFPGFSLEIGDQLLFPVSTSSNSIPDQTYVTDGTAAGTHSIPLSLGAVQVRPGSKEVIGLHTTQPGIWRSNLAPNNATQIDNSIERNFPSIVPVSSSTTYIRTHSKLYVNDGTLASTRILFEAFKRGQNLSLDNIFGTEGSRVYFGVFDNTTQPDNSVERNQIWHSNGAVESTYQLFLSYDDGLPPDEPDPVEPPAPVLSPIIDLLMDPRCPMSGEVARKAFVDQDGDGVGSGEEVIFCAGQVVPEKYSFDGFDCDDANASVWRIAALYRDIDGDGVGSGTSQAMCIGKTVASGLSLQGFDPVDTLGDPNSANISEDELSISVTSFNTFFTQE